MKKIVCLLFLLAAVGRLPAQVTGNVISRVLQIRFNGFTGSAFFLEYGAKSYFITANHMVVTAGDHATVDVLGGVDSLWHPIEFDILHGSTPCADVAVLVAKDTKVTSIDPLPFDDKSSFAMGQETYFLGFPFGLFGSFDGQRIAVPLIKHGYVSAVVPCSAIYPDGTKDSLILLDGINNHGFSGGPVVAPDVFDGTRTLKLIGVISGYKYEDEPIKNEKGQTYPDASGSANSGIIIVIPIERAITLIKDHVAKENAKKPK